MTSESPDLSHMVGDARKRLIEEQVVEHDRLTNDIGDCSNVVLGEE